jgi:PAS domain S-box-containing protein
MARGAVLPAEPKSFTRQAVLLAGALLAVIVLVLAGGEIWRAHDATLRGAEARLATLSLALGEHTARTFQTVDLVVSNVADSIAAGDFAGKNAEDLSAELRKRIVGVPLIIGLAIIDRDGGLVAMSRTIRPETKPPAAQRDFFVRHRDNPQFGLLVGAPFRAVVDGRWVVPVTRGLRDRNGAFAGVVAAAVDPAYLQDIYSKVRPPEGGAFALYRNDGVLLTRFPAIEEAVGKDFSHLRVFEEIRRGATAPFWVPSGMDNAPRLVSFAVPGGFPLVMTAAVDRSMLLEKWGDGALRLGLAALFTCVVIAAAVVLLLGQMRHHSRQAMALLEAERQRRFAQFAIDHAGDMVLWLDLQGRITYANGAAAALVGWSAENLVGRPITDIDPDYDDATLARDIPELCRRGRMRFESTMRRRDGSDFAVEVSANHVEFEGEDRICAFVRDISEHKRAEAALADNAARLEASNAELEQFAYVASHDLREPLRMIASFVGMLSRRYGDRLDDEGREFIAFAQDGAARMDRLILDLLEYSRVGRLDRPLAPLPLGEVAEMAAQSLALAASEADATIAIAPHLPMVNANREELVRVMLNLIGNAIKYRHPERRPEVRIGGERRDGDVLVWVSDNGIGIAPQYFDRIFRIFQRLHSRDQYDGTGIGLAVCKKIIERHGGRIWIESEPDHGSTFLFTLRGVSGETAATAQLADTSA